MLTVSQLFTPAPSGVGPFGNVPLVPPQGTWLSVMLSVAAQVQLPTTSWQPGAPERTILAIQAVTFSESDVNISTMAQGGFLQSAASGTVTYVTINGTTVTVPVTPDPSNQAQNPTGALGWLDVLSESVYDVTRLAATQAVGPLAIANLKGTSVGPYAIGGYHVANANTGASYSNPESITIPSSIIAGSGGIISFVQPGFVFTIITTAAPHGLSAGQVVYIVLSPATGITFPNGTGPGGGVFAVITSTTTNTIAVTVQSAGTFTFAGTPTIYLCTVATMAADVAGIASNAAPGAVTTAITQNSGVFVSNVVGWSGSNWESNTSLATRCQNSLAIRSPNGPAQAYIFYADTAQQILSTGTLPAGGGSWPVYQLTNGPVIANEYAIPQTGVVTTVVASTTPASTSLGANVTPGFAQLLVASISAATNAVVTCAGPTGMIPGQSLTVTISGVLYDMENANGTFVGTYASPDSFSINVDTSGGIYLGGGSVEGGDLGQIDLLLQQNVVPDNTVARTVSAQALPISIQATVVVPQAYVATYTAAVKPQLQAQMQSYAVGGNAPDYEVAYDDIVGALEEAGVLVLGQPSYVRQVQALSLNNQGNGLGVAFPTPYYQALLAAANITVLGV